MNLEKFRALGVTIKSAEYGFTPGDMVCLDAYGTATKNMHSEDYGKVQKMACYAAARIFENAGLVNDRFYHVFTKLATYPAWHDELDVFSDSVLESLGLFKKAEEFLEKENKNDMHVKSAMTQLKKILGIGAAITPEMLHAVAAASALTGTAGGGILWLLNRHSSEDDVKNEMLSDKIDYYNNLSKEIKNRLKSKVNASPSDIKKEVEEVFSNNII